MRRLSYQITKWAKLGRLGEIDDSHMHLSDGGWGRQTTARELPIATEVAGVNMRLIPGGVREMHWHKAAEWAYMLKGRARITAIEGLERFLLVAIVVVIALAVLHLVWKTLPK